uniref:SJCHGC03093 protein n=1 Tax=Schistosoma japonicum TaxID=6182 RepID=Q3MJV8_SCHJA|nr:SJCHGC03093 protein [Schistosoma japonicum]
MLDHHVARRAMLAGQRVGWNKGRGSQTNIWHQSMKTLTVGLRHIGSYRLA